MGRALRNRSKNEPKPLDCIAFLQWAPPRRDLRWAGFRKVRRQVCKRLKRRMAELDLGDFSDYRSRLESDPQEWRTFDECCHITISRFYRDRGVFDTLRWRVLPDIATRADRERRQVCAWSAGCASGEEPYTLKVLWDLELALSHPDISLTVTATDADQVMVGRARAACYREAGLRELPLPLLEQGFDRLGSLFCVKPTHRQGIQFVRQDLRLEAPATRFDLILCRCVAFTYFAPPLQRRVLATLLDRLLPHGYLVIGTHERLPSISGLVALDHAPQIFQRTAAERETIAGSH